MLLLPVLFLIYGGLLFRKSRRMHRTQGLHIIVAICGILMAAYGVILACLLLSGTVEPLSF